MRPTVLIARDELRLMSRNRVAIIALVLLMLLTLVAVISAWSQQRSLAELRGRHAVEAQAAFESQPARHPHRMVHYGTFIFRPPGPLAAFDPGVDAFTGNSMFLEGHRQNTANFGDVRQSSILIRFGQLTPAFVLQVVAPLFLIFLGYGVIARETEKGTVRLLLLHGAGRGELVRGKLLALGCIAVIACLPATGGLLLAFGQPGTALLPMLVITLGHLAYVALWIVLIVLVSAIVGRSREALFSLIAVWALTAVLLPRIAPDVAIAAIPLQNRLQADIAIARDLRQLGDAHNPNDPHFAEFKQSVLRRYHVTRVEDLPVNYQGVLALEGERLTSELFDRYAKASFAAQDRQNRLVGMIGLLSPTIAISSLSMAAAGTDFAAYRRFLEQAEAYRYDLVQRLNRLQAEAVSYADDTAEDPDADRRSRISADNWHGVPAFAFEPSRGSDLARGALPGLAVVCLWLTLASGLLALATRHLGTRG